MKNLKYLCFFIFISLSSQSFANFLILNEVVSSNSQSLILPDGSSPDRIELKNTSQDKIKLEAYYLSDDSSDLKKWALPSIELEGGAYLIICASGLDKYEANYYHSNFKLKSSGETVYLSQLYGIDTIIIDSLTYPLLADDLPYGRYSDGSDTLFVFNQPSPEFSNVMDFSSYSKPLIYINEYMAKGNTMFADEAGEYEDWLELYNPNDTALDVAGYYISDDDEDRYKWMIPNVSSELSTIPANGFLILFADKDTDQGANHTNFKLKSSGESVYLSYDSMSTLLCLDSLTYSSSIDMVCGAKIPDGVGEWIDLVPATPGKSNALASLAAINDIKFTYTI